MTTEVSAAANNLNALAQGDAPVLETLAQMTIDTRERSGLDEKTFMLVRIAALVSMDAAPASYLMNMALADDVGVSLDDIQGTLVAVAPVVGSARVVSAAGHMLRGLALTSELDDGEA